MAAERVGLRRGLSLSQARAMYPALVVAEEDTAADARLLKDIADWCQRYTPLVGLNAPDGVLLDIAGCAHLFGGEAALIDDLMRRVRAFGFDCIVGVACTIGAAWAMARHGQGGFIAPGCERERLLSLPLPALRIDAETVAALGRVGFKRIGDIVDFARAPLSARFGADMLRQLDRALGLEGEPLTPLLPVAPYFAEQPFPEPIAREEDILAVTERLARRLSLMLERHGEGMRRVELTLFRTDGKVHRIEAGTSRPIRDAAEVRALFVERLAALADPIDPGFGFDLARLSVVTAETYTSQQIALEEDDDGADLGRLVDRVSARLGARRVTQLVAQDSHTPELAAVSMPAQSAHADTEHGWDAFRRFRAAAELPPRPLRLLARPEPIEAVASVPDGPPVRFRWRRALHEVAAVEGPERIEGAWWRDDGGTAPENLARDYFRVEDLGGHRFWIFRAGLYRDTAMPAWFLHGLFA